MNLFSKTQRSVAAAGDHELRRNSVSKILSPISILQTSDALSEVKCSLCLLWLLFCVHSVESLKDIKGEKE